jgi:hypothetical protein
MNPMRGGADGSKTTIHQHDPRGIIGTSRLHLPLRVRRELFSKKEFLGRQLRMRLRENGTSRTRSLTTRRTVRAVTRHRHCPHGKRMVHEAFAVDSAIVWSVFAQRRHRSSIKTAGFCWMNLLRITAPIDVRTEVLPDIKT